MIRVIGIGETGLDFYYENSEKNIQIQLFKRHINVSRETQFLLLFIQEMQIKQQLIYLMKKVKKVIFQE